MALAETYVYAARGEGWDRRLDAIERDYRAYCEQRDASTLGSVNTALEYLREKLEAGRGEAYVEAFFAMLRRMHALARRPSINKDPHIVAFRAGLARLAAAARGPARNRYSPPAAYRAVAASLGDGYRFRRIGAIVSLARWGGATRAQMLATMREATYREADGYRMVIPDHRFPEILVGGELPCALIERFLEARGEAPGPLLISQFAASDKPLSAGSLTRWCRVLFAQQGVPVGKCGDWRPIMRSMDRTTYEALVQRASATSDVRVRRATVALIFARAGLDMAEAAAVRYESLRVDGERIRIAFAQYDATLELSATSVAGRFLLTMLEQRGDDPGYLLRNIEPAGRSALSRAGFDADMQMALALAQEADGSAIAAFTAGTLRRSFLRDAVDLLGPAQAHSLMGFESTTWLSVHGVTRPVDPRDNSFRRKHRIAKSKGRAK